MKYTIYLIQILIRNCDGLWGGGKGREKKRKWTHTLRNIVVAGTDYGRHIGKVPLLDCDLKGRSEGGGGASSRNAVTNTTSVPSIPLIPSSCVVRGCAAPTGGHSDPLHSLYTLRRKKIPKNKVIHLSSLARITSSCSILVGRILLI